MKEVGIWGGGGGGGVSVCGVDVLPQGRAYVWGSGGGETTFNDTLNYVILLVAPGERRVLKDTVHLWSQ